MRKLILALMALACFTGLAQAQQQQTSTVDQGKAGVAPWPITWTGQSVLADLRVAGNPVSTGNPVPVAGTVTANVGTTNGLALDSSLQTIRTTLGSPFQAGGSIGNTSFGISGTLPAFAATPTFNLGTLNGAATANNQATEITNLQAIAQRAVIFMETGGTGVGANGQFDGSIRDLGAAPAYSRVNAVAFSSSQPATLTIKACFDSACASNVPVSAAVSIPAGGSGFATAYAITRYYRVNVTNTSSSGSTTAIVGSSFTAN